MGRSSFYIHFDDLYGLAASLLEAIDEELAASTQEGRTAGTPTAGIENAISGVVDVWQRNGPVLRAIADASTQDARLEDLYRGGFTQRRIERIRLAVEARQAEGLVDAGLDPLETATLLTFMTEAHLSDRMGRDPRGDPELPYRAVIRAPGTGTHHGR